MDTALKLLYDAAKEIAGREVEVAKTTDGKYIVEWINYNMLPPPKGDTEADALEVFVKYLEQQEYKHGTDDQAVTEDSPKDEGISSLTRR